MVGLVIVSHSRMLAEGVVELASEMADKNLHMIAAGGLADGSIGTDAVLIMRAILEADTGEGVVVLTDIGSSILSTQVAIELIEDEIIKERIKISPASLVEGALVAAVEASTGASLQNVLDAAIEANSVSKI